MGIAWAFSTMGCTASYKALVPQYASASSSMANDRPNYSELVYWAAHPQKSDPSDSLPEPLRSEPRDTVADVFFLHPTTYTRNKKEWNADINDPELNAKTDYTTILYQATAFNQHARVFAPRYRQVHLSLFYEKDTTQYAAFDTAYADVRRAFLQYLENDNRGRPIVLASHSQGALLTIRLLREFFDGQPLQQKLVAAYVVGWPVMPTDLNNIGVCQTPEQTGCVCSWRTYRTGYVPQHVQKERSQAWVTNPLRWTTTGVAVGRDQNKGSVLRNFNKVVPQTTSAQVAGGVLWVEKPKFPGAFLLRTKNYHIGDINLFYVDVRHNVAQRIAAYLKARSF